MFTEMSWSGGAAAGGFVACAKLRPEARTSPAQIAMAVMLAMTNLSCPFDKCIRPPLRTGGPPLEAGLVASFDTRVKNVWQKKRKKKSRRIPQHDSATTALLVIERS